MMGAHRFGGLRRGEGGHLDVTETLKGGQDRVPAMISKDGVFQTFHADLQRQQRQTAQDFG